MAATTERSARAARNLSRVVLVLIACEVILIAIFRARWRPGIDAVRRFNRAVLNPAMLRLAGSKHWYASVVHHVGRTSGKPYATPVLVHAAGDRLYIPLPYGTGVDWCVNVLAAGGCTVDHKGRRFTASAPVVVPHTEVAPLISGRLQRTLGLYRVTSFLRLDANADQAAVTSR
jgi:deazaflavin-dependent oxidoreductase (nitroreductase family)